MTNRERVVSTLLGEPVDKTACISWLGLTPWGETLLRWREESGFSDLNVEEYFHLDPGFAVVHLEYGPFPPFEERVLEDQGDYIVYTTRNGIKARNRKDKGSMPDFLEHPIKTEADWISYKRDRLEADFGGRFPDLGAFAAASAASDRPVQVGTFPWGAFGTARDLLGTEELLIGFYDMPDLIKDIMLTYTRLWISLYDRVSGQVGIDHIHIWEDMSGKQGSLISMEMVEEFMMPCYDLIADFARLKGIPLVSVDTDGRVAELLPVMMNHGMNAMMPFEVQAGNDILAIRKEYPDLGIFGGLDKNALAEGGREIGRELDRAEKMLAAGRWIPGFDHLIPPNVAWKDFKYFMAEFMKLISR